MKKSITIVDFSHLNMRNLFIALGQAKPRKKDGLFVTEEFIQYHKSLLFNSLQFIKNKFKNEIILATDGQNNWRKNFYTDYKANRTKAKEDNDVNFEEFFEATEEILKAIKAYFPFQVLEVNEAEADDIAGVISILHGNDIDITLVTSDHDWLQAQAHNDITIWDPIKKENRYLSDFEKEIIETDFGPMSRFTIIHALIGDKGDNVPTITGMSHFSEAFLSYLKENGINSDCVKTVTAMDSYNDLVEDYNVFQLITAGKLKGQYRDIKDIFKTKPYGEKKAIKHCENNDSLNEFLNSHIMYRDNFRRNKTLVDFKEIPEEVHNKIMINFSEATVNYDPNGMLEYFMNEKLGLHASNINKFYTTKYNTIQKSSLDDFLDF
jgi:5'-3' exonuclease